MAQRTFSKTIKQTQTFGFEKQGDSYEGTYVGTKLTTIEDKDGKREALLILLDPDEGDKFGVWANQILSDLIAQVPANAYIRITHTGEGPKKGKKSPAKLFQIEIAD